ncbi:hypothetical protein GCM10022239_01220 [Leifsonia bigeumensis]|uniref:Hemerythrin-like domain-containing protein n=1 Tax=Leifsonella bigeumensis TaxID=433643 RepID=A0ABP7F133_9MICO
MSPVDADGAGCATDDLLIVHRLLRTLFGKAPGLVESCGSDRRQTRIDEHLDEITGALHRHHHGEDITLWDRLTERRPACALHVELMRSQHADISDLLDEVDAARAAWRADRLGGGAALLVALDRLNLALNAHLADEERFVPEAAGALLTQAEWDEMRDHGIATMPRDRLLIQLGYLMREMDSDEERERFWRGVPVMARALYRLFGARQLSRELAELYGSADPAR